MRHWSYNEPTADGGNHIVTMSETEIIESYFPYWDAAMRKKFGDDYQRTYGVQECIDDWIVVNWAWEST